MNETKTHFGSILFSIAALAFAGCASTTYNGYAEGTVKYSQVKYEYTAQPVLADPAGKTYQLVTDPSLSGLSAVAGLEKRGVKRADGGADVVITVRGGKITHEPGSMGLGGKYKPALISRMPLTITVKDGKGSTIVERKAQHEEYLAVNGAKSFGTRQEAKAAMASVTDMMKKSADKKVQQGAARAARKRLDVLAKNLFEPRDIAVQLPAIRSAGDVDMEAAYTLLADAESSTQVDRALAAYRALGTEHKKADGTDDVIGVYGVLCGVASAKVLGGDLLGAWQDTKKAHDTFPMGKEARIIAQVLHKQQQEAGVEVIPPEEFDEMMNADKKMMADQLKALFGGKKN